MVPLGVPRRPAAMEPTSEEFATLLTVGAVLNWVPVREPLRTSVMGALQIFDDDPVRILAALPGEVIQDTLKQLDATPTDAARMEVA